MKKYFIAVITLYLMTFRAFAWDVGEVSTVFKVMAPNDKIVVSGFHDPDVSGITCHVSRAKKGGAASVVGMAEDTSDASIACRQTGLIPLICEKRGNKLCLDLSEQKEVFSKSTSLLFKSLHVIRMYDEESYTLVYLAYSDKLIDGSPKNSISTIPLFRFPK
jgi:CreA protein